MRFGCRLAVLAGRPMKPQAGKEVAVPIFLFSFNQRLIILSEAKVARRQGVLLAAVSLRMLD